MHSTIILLLAFLAVCSQVTSLPTPEISTVQIIQDQVNTANAAVRGDMASIMSAVVASSGDQAQVISALVSDLASVASHLSTAGSSITSSTTSAGTTLTAPEALALASSMMTVQDLAATMLADYAAAKVELSTDTMAATKSEWAAAIHAIKPFSDPIALYASKIKEDGISAAGPGSGAIQVASMGMQAMVRTLLSSAGVGT